MAEDRHLTEVVDSQAAAGLEGAYSYKKRFIISTICAGVLALTNAATALMAYNKGDDAEQCKAMLSAVQRLKDEALSREGIKNIEVEMLKTRFHDSERAISDGRNLIEILEAKLDKCPNRGQK